MDTFVESTTISCPTSEPSTTRPDSSLKYRIDMRFPTIAARPPPLTETPAWLLERLFSDTTTPGRVSFAYQTWIATSAWLRLFRATVRLLVNSKDRSQANPVTVESSTRPFETSMKRMPAKPRPGGWWTYTSRMTKLASVSRMKTASVVSTFVISHPAMRYGSSGVP